MEVSAVDATMRSTQLNQSSFQEKIGKHAQGINQLSLNCTKVVSIGHPAFPRHVIFVRAPKPSDGLVALRNFYDSVLSAFSQQCAGSACNERPQRLVMPPISVGENGFNYNDAANVGLAETCSYLGKLQGHGFEVHFPVHQGNNQTSANKENVDAYQKGLGILTLLYPDVMGHIHCYECGVERFCEVAMNDKTMADAVVIPFVDDFKMSPVFKAISAISEISKNNKPSVALPKPIEPLAFSRAVPADSTLSQSSKSQSVSTSSAPDNEKVSKELYQICSGELRLYGMVAMSQKPHFITLYKEKIPGFLPTDIIHQAVVDVYQGEATDEVTRATWQVQTFMVLQKEQDQFAKLCATKDLKGIDDENGKELENLSKSEANMAKANRVLACDAIGEKGIGPYWILSPMATIAKRGNANPSGQVYYYVNMSALNMATWFCVNVAVIPRFIQARRTELDLNDPRCPVKVCGGNLEHNTVTANCLIVINLNDKTRCCDAPNNTQGEVVLSCYPHLKMVEPAPELDQARGLYVVHAEVVSDTTFGNPLSKKYDSWACKKGTQAASPTTSPSLLAYDVETLKKSLKSNRLIE